MSPVGSLTRTTLGVVLFLGLLSACSFVSLQPPKQAKEGKAAFHAAGVPTSEIAVYATTLNRLPGLVFVGSASDVPGTAAPIGKSREVLNVRIGPSQQLHLRAWVAEPHSPDTKCVFSPEAMSVLSQTLDDLYRGNPMAAFPADVHVTFVPDGIEVRRTEYAWRFGKTAVFRYWFACDPTHADESLMTAYLLLTHELTHAVVSYRGAEAETLKDVEASERIADGAMACLYLLMPPPLGDKLRSSDAARAAFLNPSDRARNDPNKDVSCSAWRAQMRALPD